MSKEGIYAPDFKLVGTKLHTTSKLLEVALKF